MRLLDDFYTLLGTVESDEGPSFELMLNAGHFIYAAHFPGHPVTPGACIVQMIGELIGLRLGRQLKVNRITSLRYLAPIDPRVDGRIEVVVQQIEPQADGFKVQLQIRASQRVMVKFSGLLVES